jgi:hypothetical protein
MMPVHGLITNHAIVVFVNPRTVKIFETLEAAGFAIIGRPYER